MADSHDACAVSQRKLNDTATTSSGSLYWKYSAAERLCWCSLSPMIVMCLGFWTLGQTKQNIWICQLHTHTHTHPFYKFKRGLSWLPILSWPQFTDQCDPNPISLQLFTVSGFQREETIHSSVFRGEVWKARQWSLSFLFKRSPLLLLTSRSMVFLHSIFIIMLREHRLKKKKKSRSLFPRRSALHVAPTHKHHPPTKAAAVPVYDMTKASQIKWRMTKGREKRRMFHFSISRE